VPVLAVNESVRFLPARGITARYGVFVGPVELTTLSIVQPASGVTYLLASICPPSAFNAVPTKSTLLRHPRVPGLHQRIAPLVKRQAKKRPVKFFGAGRTCALHAIEITQSTGSDELHLLGLYSSFQNSAMHAFPSAGDALENTKLVVACGST